MPPWDWPIKGYEVILTEKEAELGGLANRLTATIEGANIGDYLSELIPRVTNHPKIHRFNQCPDCWFFRIQGQFHHRNSGGTGNGAAKN